LPFWYTRAGTRLGAGREQGVGLGGATAIGRSGVVGTGAVGKGSAVLRSLDTAAGGPEGPALSQAQTSTLARTARRQIEDGGRMACRLVAHEFASRISRITGDEIMGHI